MKMPVYLAYSYTLCLSIWRMKMPVYLAYSYTLCLSIWHMKMPVYLAYFLSQLLEAVLSMHQLSATRSFCLSI